MTLIELLIAMVVLALLATVAYPAYRSQINKAYVAQAVTDIQKVEMALERYYTASGSFPPDLDTAGLAMNDPWGNPYRYLNMDGASVGKVRKDKSLHPLNTDYDLYSMGADGKSVSPLTAQASRDDIIRANNGAFIGLASAF